MQEIPTHLLARFEALYTRLRDETTQGLIPAREKILEAIAQSSFRVFDSPEEYATNERAAQYVQFISNEHGDRAYRVYFNEYSKKIYVDLNPGFTGIQVDLEMIKEQVRSEVSYEILKTLILTHPLFQDPGIWTGTEEDA